MPNIENGSRFEAIQKSLDSNPNLTVIDQTEESIFDGRKGVIRQEAKIIVNQNQGQEVDIQNILNDVSPVFRRENTLRSFDKLGPREYRTIAVEIQPSPDSKTRL